jgi:hypothetical protein
VAGVLLGPQVAAAQQPADTLARRQIDSLAAVVGALTAQLEQVSAAQVAGPARAPGAFMNVSLVGLTTAGWSTEADVESLQLGAHDPRTRGFGVPNAELALDGAVDPYFQARAFIVYGLDAGGETTVELEEMYFLTSALPHNLQLKGGQAFLDFGRQNPQHPHSWVSPISRWS